VGQQKGQQVAEEEGGGEGEEEEEGEGGEEEGEGEDGQLPIYPGGVKRSRMGSKCARNVQPLRGPFLDCSPSPPLGLYRPELGCADRQQS
jgi:hypothetical protein